MASVPPAANPFLVSIRAPAVGQFEEGNPYMRRPSIGNQVRPTRPSVGPHCFGTYHADEPIFGGPNSAPGGHHGQPLLFNSQQSNADPDPVISTSVSLVTTSVSCSTVLRIESNDTGWSLPPSVPVSSNAQSSSSPIAQPHSVPASTNAQDTSPAVDTTRLATPPVLPVGKIGEC
ncbi:hypothetical protein GOBAR_AA31014 [Gossypium barbadense]|uniref:Uncharacterized protein n=1 Tax=Gossypium barbadense TaxID=3634 RepID=A0A2P5WF20_GOSBA|nr:hypothetical protein GOBAR_AA31014 [Gossypium barbadense]